MKLTWDSSIAQNLFILLRLLILIRKYNTKILLNVLIDLYLCIIDIYLLHENISAQLLESDRSMQSLGKLICELQPNRKFRESQPRFVFCLHISIIHKSDLHNSISDKKCIDKFQQQTTHYYQSEYNLSKVETCTSKQALLFYSHRK